MAGKIFRNEYSGYYILLIVIVSVYITGLFITIMEVDAAQLASISSQMLRDDSFLQVRNGNLDYLDKPPLLFWCSALFIKLFGLSSFSYKFGPMLGLLLSIFSIYKFSRLNYKIETSLAAAVILAGSQVYFLMVNDVRAENLLIGFSCLAIWQIAAYIKDRKPVNLYLGFAGIGFAMVAKGPIGLVFPAFTIGTMLVYGNLRSIGWRWLMAIPIIGVILLPMCIGLYQQFGVEGLEFYFWTQSFGRITGASDWENSAGALFFAHSFLWIFLPYSIIFIPAVFSSIKDLASKGVRPGMVEVGSIGGFLLTMIALSMSNYKLPHYIYPITTLAAVMSAVYLFEKAGKKTLKILNLSQLIFLSLLLVLSVFIIRLFNQSYPVFLSVFLVITLAAAYLFWKKKDFRKNLVLISALAITFINLGLNTVFYPRLLKYQSGSEAIFYMQENGYGSADLVSYDCWHQSLAYFLDADVPVLSEPEELDGINTGTFIFTTDKGLAEMTDKNMKFEIIKEFEHYHITLLTSNFLNPATRENVISSRYLVRNNTAPRVN